MIKNLNREMYLYSVDKKLFQGSYYIKRQVLLDVNKLIVGDSKRPESWTSSYSSRESFDFNYWETPEEAFNAWQKRIQEHTKKRLKELKESYEEDCRSLKDKAELVKGLSFGDLELEGYPDDWFPVNF